MRSTALTAIAVTGVIGLSGPTLAQSDNTEALLRRLEAKVEALSKQNDTLAKQNAALGDRVRKMESRSAAAKPATTAEPAADPNLSQAARMANAAYMPVKGGPAYRNPCASFGGWYAGAHAGWALHNNTWVDRNAWVDVFSIDWALGSANATNDGVTAGLQGGYNWQSGCSLFGIEIDGSWANLDNSRHYTPAAGAGLLLTIDTDAQWFGTIRARAGLVNDNLLLYVTGGAAVARIKNVATINDTNIPTVESFSSDTTRFGLAVGAGAEWAWTPTMSLKGEVLYLKFPDKHIAGFTPNGPGPVAFDLQDSIWVARLGLNFKLGDWGKGPVSAKY